MGVNNFEVIAYDFGMDIRCARTCLASLKDSLPELVTAIVSQRPSGKDALQGYVKWYLKTT